MPDVIRLMPDSLANQIAAGEVIQRPASIVKELVENSVDAGATNITVNIKDAGRTLVQVIDNGCGMSETDARMSFERHATSKIYKPEDLFCIYTKGFRGEALASIAAVAEVELKTRCEGAAMGTDVIISGSSFVSQTPCSTPKGTNFCVKSLFFNVPARRKFLKSNATEFQHIVSEFQRVALTHPSIEFTLYHNDVLIYSLPVVNLKQRILGVFGKNLNSELIPVDIDTSIVKITGFTGKPSNSKRKSDRQYFFVNNRYMRSQYFHKAVALAYDKLVMPDCIPAYFLYFEVDPHSIDINIHPTKTEINFENAPDVFKLLQAGICETLSKSDVAPAIDFYSEGDSHIPYFPKNAPIPSMPEVNFNPFYNPFEHENGGEQSKHILSYKQEDSDFVKKHNLQNWQSLFDSDQQDNTAEFNDTEKVAQQKLMQLKGKYIVSPVKSGLMIIDQRRAHLRILYENYLSKITDNADAVQTLLYPIEIESDMQTYTIVYDVREELASVGFDVEYGETNYIIKGVPPFLEQNDAIEVFNGIIESYKNEYGSASSSIKEILALTAAKRQAIKYGDILMPEEMRKLIDNLFATSMPNFSPDGKPIICIESIDDIEKRFQ